MNKQLNDNIPFAHHFKWKEALFLPKWNIFVVATTHQEANIISITLIMEKIRAFFGKPILILSWLRPDFYNDWPFPYGVMGAKNSAHKLGLACDFCIRGFTADEIRRKLEPELLHLGIRMENLPGSDWVHVDLFPPGITGRFFTP